MYGHAGDGNIHTRPILSTKDPDDLRTMKSIMDEAMQVVIDLKATPSGEHGDGIVRSPYVRMVYGDEVYGVFKEIKDRLRPHRHHEPRQEDRERGGHRRPGHQPALRPVTTTRTSSPRCSIFPTASTSARSRSATAAPSARAWWPRRCAPPTKPPCGSTPRRAPKPTSCGTSSRGSSTHRPPTWRTQPRRSTTTASNAACARWSVRRTSTSPS